uniref:Rev protein n=1 Tax=Rabbit endogenous lentivirus type K TaxID=596477 RepID=A0A3Q9T7Q0_9RETR|nr:rev protein [Rabbit endogenous lentivirus type K]AZY88396.1 rev protein [Rabbit endogenous lentivirus type K]AZY88401.1 rev protein [Rabbit endogenous lentivirus type K]
MLAYLTAPLLNWTEFREGIPSPPKDTQPTRNRRRRKRKKKNPESGNQTGICSRMFIPWAQQLNGLCRAMSTFKEKKREDC